MRPTTARAPMRGSEADEAERVPQIVPKRLQIRDVNRGNMHTASQAKALMCRLAGDLFDEISLSQIETSD